MFMDVAIWRARWETGGWPTHNETGWVGDGMGRGDSWEMAGRHLGYETGGGDEMRWDTR